MNPFEQIDKRLSNIERFLEELCSNNPPAEPEKEDLIGAEEAARLMHISIARFYIIHSKMLNARKPGKKILFSRKEVLDYINSKVTNSAQSEVRVMKTRKYHRA